ncbi:hypothetical protein [Massilia sp. NR 4-1]|uniref:hypothetical protein n=1 Tax=Massilia sp. NR 4-1 TaxID=1678028 RepID=UPI00067A7920|nr:hypothetical protein [Massilia sp. NR 4-1]AKU21426.1 hypothetical protein ACZ75_07995 [Massilia sp. NR 4-1]
MRLPGTRYQEHGWEQVRKLLGHCSLQAFQHCEMHHLLDRAQEAALLDWYIDAVAVLLRRAARSARGEVAGNSYGDSVAELSLSLLYELQVQPAFWSAFAAAVAVEHGRAPAFWASAAGDAMLRKKVNDMFATLRDKVDADNYQVATGRSCSPNKIYTYRMLDTAFGEIERLFANWEQNAEQVGAILGRASEGIPIEVRQMRSIGGCRPEWLIRWSETLERFGGAPGPLHTKSKRFSSLKNNPEKIGAMLAEIGDYAELSSNQDTAVWASDAEEAALWLEDYWRVVAESQAQGALAQPDRLLPAEEDEEEDGAQDTDAGGDAAPDPVLSQAVRTAWEAAAAALSLPLRYMELAGAAQDRGSPLSRLLDGASLPVRLAVYQKLLGAADDSYPDEWLDPETGELPTLGQLATLDQVSVPTLRKRRNEAIDRLYAAHGARQP